MAWTQDEASANIYAMQKRIAGSPAAKKAWNDGLMAPRYYDCFRGEVLSLL